MSFGTGGRVDAGKGGAIYYIAVIELDKKWWENNKDHTDLKAMLDEKLKTGGIGFRGTLHSSSLMADISKNKRLE